MNELPENIAHDDATFRLWVVQTLTELSVNMSGQMKSREDLENRVRQVERKTYALTGAATMLNIAIALFLKVIK